MSTFLSSPNGAFMKLGSTFLAVPLPPTPSRGRAVFKTGTCSKQILSLGGRHYRAQFMVLPTDADNTQFATCNNGISTGSGVGIFWVTSFRIDSDGTLHITGRKASSNSNSCQNSSGWPTAPSNKLYYYGSQSFGGVSTEAHKCAQNVPSDAVAVIIAYKNQTEEQITCNTIETDSTYTDVTDSMCGFCVNQTTMDEIYALAGDTETSYDIPSTDMYYPLQSNRTILCGSKNSLTAL